MASSGHEVTELLRAWSEGGQSALEQPLPTVYDALHRLPRYYMTEERPGRGRANGN
jgi:hypothetical protein